MDTTITTEAWLPFLLQTSDAVFPTGAYAHSHGLEEMVRAGRVRDEAGLGDFLRQHVAPSAIHLDLPIVREARTAALADDWKTFTSLDQMAGALRPARELREASLQIGRRRLAILAKLHPRHSSKNSPRMLRRIPLPDTTLRSGAPPVRACRATQQFSPIFTR